LSKPETVSPKTRLRVQAAIERLDYVPDSAARSLSLRRTRSIGVVLPTLDYSIFARFIEALQHRTDEAGYSVLIATSGFDQERELAQARTLVGHGIEALVVTGEHHRPELYRLLESRGIPYVHSSVYSPDSGHPCVGYDNKGAAKQAAEHLLSLGHQTFGALIGPRESNDRMALRVEGIREALRAQGLALPETRIVERAYSVSRGREGFRELMAREPGVTALLCGNDVLAFGALLEARAMVIEVPRDLSVVGFDNLEWASEISPRLTTIQVPTYDMGTATAEQLIGRLAGRPFARHVEIELNFILRESTGPAPGRGASNRARIPG
jgi:LacI family transcriptional regulator